MVERAGTDKFEEPGIDDDTDLFDPEQKARKAAGKPAFPSFSKDYAEIKKYIGDLTAYYLMQMTFSSQEDAEVALELLNDIYSDGLKDKEQMVSLMKEFAK